MHELTICYHLIQTLQDEVESNVQSIKKIWLAVGELAGIEIDALQFSFPIAAKNSIAANAKLIIHSVAGTAWCETCQLDVNIKTSFAPCPRCGSYDYQIQRGKELMITKIEVG